MKKLISVLSSILFVLFSFFYTNKLIEITKNNDPIMVEIMNYSDDYNDSKTEAILINNNIIPGVIGKKVNINKSYTAMKKVGKFDKNLIVFEESKIKEPLNNNYDKYIISGNKEKNNVSIIIELKDTTHLEEILNTLNKKETLITFFIDSDIFDNDIEAIKLIKSFGHDIELLSNDYSIYEVNKYNSILKLISDDKISFCLNNNRDDNLLKNCESSKLHTIVPSINVTNYLYNTIRHNLENGSIILINNNLVNLKELIPTINYINQKGKKIVLLSNLIQE